MSTDTKTAERVDPCTPDRRPSTPGLGVRPGIPGAHGEAIVSPLFESLDDPEIPITVREFCARRRIGDEVLVAISLARKLFAMVGPPAFDLVNDDESDEHYVGIHIWARGGPEDVFRQGQAFRDSFRNSIDREKRDLINVIYHAI